MVVIGRNEGERLRRCLAGVTDRPGVLVYVDSGSTDESIKTAEQGGATVERLDPARPFSAARARNAGFERARSLDPGLIAVQFVDGDCELTPGWLRRASEALASDARAAAVCGRLRERHPESSIYNRLCQMEWDGPIGEVAACGGVAMYRVSALQEVGGFREDMIAGEEPELCHRLRQADWKILRLDAEMALHDAAMTRLGQWLKRTRRAGHAFAHCYWLHRAERFRLRESLRALAWGCAGPVILAASLVLSLVSLWFLLPMALVAALYVVSLIRTMRSRSRRGDPVGDAWLYAVFCTLGKLPEGFGVLRFAGSVISGRQTRLIEYKR